MKGIQIYEKDKKRIITFLRCGHRYIKQIVNKKKLPFFKEIQPILDEHSNVILFPYTGKTFFILRDPKEHLLSSIIFTIGSWHIESIRQTFTDFYLLKPEEKLKMVIDEIYYQRNNHHWVPKRYETIYKILCEFSSKQHYDFVILNNLKNFVEETFGVVEEYNSDKYGYQMYTKEEIIHWIDQYPPKNYEKLLRYCDQETYYYNLLINKKIKKELCHDYIS